MVGFVIVKDWQWIVVLFKVFGGRSIIANYNPEKKDNSINARKVTLKAMKKW